LNDPG